MAEKGRVVKKLLGLTGKKFVPKAIKAVTAVACNKDGFITTAKGFLDLEKHPELKFLDLNGDGQLTIKDIHDATWKGVLKIIAVLVVIAALIIGRKYIESLLGFELL